MARETALETSAAREDTSGHSNGREVSPGNHSQRERDGVTKLLVVVFIFSAVMWLFGVILGALDAFGIYRAKEKTKPPPGN